MEDHLLTKVINQIPLEAGEDLVQQFLELSKLEELAEHRLFMQEPIQPEEMVEAPQELVVQILEMAEMGPLRGEVLEELVDQED
tara:strand:+ start:157 stop:408 length:252 start_codon:yes stop_codon:yes gene_type:complete